MLRDVTIEHLVEDMRGREAGAVHELLGVLTSTARRLEPDERTALARAMVGLANAIDPAAAEARLQ